MTRLKGSDLVALGFMTFALFLGAGNIIFPASAGMASGDNIWPVALGFLLTGVPASMGGLWRDVASSTRPIAELLRTLARGDPSVALVSSMHPAVLSFWLCQPEAPAPHTDPWRQQVEAR